ncbi:MAG: HlyD family efflux transporter periplasmic adaptor subunit [Flavobacteriales bacterium]|nr:HlyD family efflux transporter periplasmic adaptor subunit [Flavobacteriales bacterium]
MRKVIQSIVSVVVAIAFVAGGVTLAEKLAGSKPALPKSNQSGAATIFTKTVKNGAVPVEIKATGVLMALNRMDLFSEVQGVMQPDGGKFKAGNRFSKGHSLISIDAADYRANLMSQRSNLQNLITSALADIRLDFPQSFDRWNRYATDFDINSSIPELPEPASDQEKMFISGRKILSTYYSIKNAEIVLAKYNLTAPFNGVLTEATVTPGTVIRPGLKLGTFIDPTVFELETPINSAMMDYLKVGQNVKVAATDNSGKSWEGKVIRINNLVDAATQTMNAYLRVSGKGLEEGMFLEASIAATEIENAVELPREMLLPQDLIYITDGTTLSTQAVTPLYFMEKTVIIGGLEDGQQVLIKMPPSAYSGMEVSISQD